VAAWRAALTLAPTDARLHSNLGSALVEQKDLAGAVALFEKAVQLQPDFAEAHCNLGHVLRRQGRLAEALAALKRGDELGSRRKAWTWPSAVWGRDCARLLELEGKLAQAVSGARQPADREERLELAQLARKKGRYAAAARFYEEILNGRPKEVATH